MLAAAAPDARLLVLLRDPVERYLSGLQRHHRVARATEAPLNAMAPLDAFHRGLYHAQLGGLLRHFSRAQLLVLQYERCTRDTRGELRRTYEFLGLEDAGLLPDLRRHPNRQPDKPELHRDARAALIDAYAEDVATLVRDFPEIDLALWPSFGESEGAGSPSPGSSGYPGVLGKSVVGWPTVSGGALESGWLAGSVAVWLCNSEPWPGGPPVNLDPGRPTC